MKWVNLACWDQPFPNNMAGQGRTTFPTVLWHGKWSGWILVIVPPMSVQSSLVMHPIFAYGTEEQRTKFLPDLAAGKKIGCFGLTRKPDHGSDAGSMTTRAKKAGEWAICYRAPKTGLPNSPVADVMVVWAKSDAHDGKIRGFILERGMKGLETPKIEGKVFVAGLRVTGMIQMARCVCA